MGLIMKKEEILTKEQILEFNKKDSEYIKKCFSFIPNHDNSYFSNNFDMLKNLEELKKNLKSQHNEMQQ